MGASLEEVHQGLGSLSVDLEPDAEILNALVPGDTLQVWWGENLVYSGVYLSQIPGRDKLTIKGRGFEFFLGLDEEGNVVRDIEFTAGNNKLSNPGAELDLLYWRTGENSYWTADANPRSGAKAFHVTASSEADDILQSDESFEAEPGQEFELNLWAKRLTGTKGIIRGRVVCEGKFNPQNILPSPTFTGGGGWSVMSGTGTGASISGTDAIVGPIERLQLLSNPYPGSTTGWSDLAGSWNHVSVGAGVYTTTGGDYAIAPSSSLTVKPGEKYKIEALVGVVPSTPATGEIYFQVDQWTGAADPIIEKSNSVPGDAPEITTGNYYNLVHELTINDDHDTLWPILRIEGYDGTGTWNVQRITITRVEGNSGGLSLNDPFQVTPLRSYPGFFGVSSPAGTTGRVKLVALYSTAVATSRADVLVDVASINGTEGQNKLMDFTLNPPSGYDFCYLFLIGEDVWGGSFTFTHGYLADGDTSTFVYEAWTNETQASYALHWAGNIVVMPEGTERVHCEVVAEEGAGGWVVDDIDFHRANVTAWESGDVVDACIRNVVTDDYLLEPGDIYGSDLIPYDLRYRNMTTKQILKQVSQAVMSPPREYKVNPDATLDWGEADEIFTDRTGVILTHDDAWLIGEPDVEQSAEHSLQRYVLIGADRSSVGKRKNIIEAEATVSAGGKVDYFGNPWTRSKITQDSTVDHIDYANSLAQYQAEQNENTKQNARLGLSDWKTLATFGVGDWIYVYLPLSGLDDAANPVDLDGQVVYPYQTRVAARNWKLGNDFKLLLRKSDDSTIDLTEFVQWEAATTAEVEVGDLLPEFVGDPQSGASGNAFLRFRASSPR